MSVWYTYTWKSLKFKVGRAVSSTSAIIILAFVNTTPALSSKYTATTVFRRNTDLNPAPLGPYSTPAVNVFNDTDAFTALGMPTSYGCSTE